MIIPCCRFTGISRISSVKVQIFVNTPVTYFLKYFRAKFREILNRESYSAFNRNFSIYYACAAFNWVFFW